MNIRVISVITILFALSISLFGCGVSSPTGANGFGSAAAGIPGPSGISFSAVFPVRPATTPTGLNVLISASTAIIKISIHDSAGNVLNNSSVTPASPSIMIPVTGYTGAVKVYITSYDSAGGLTASHIHDASIYSGMTTPISVALVEFKQGITGITGVSLMAPNNTSYPLNSLFLLPNGTAYQLGIDVGAAAPSYHISSQNVDQTTPNGTNPPNTQLFVVNDNLSFPIDVPNASKTVWNRYQININFMNGLSQTGTPMPTASPTVTGTYVGTFSAPNVPIALVASSTWFNGITSTGTQLIAVGSPGIVQTSTDIISWPQRTTPTTGSLNAITWSGTQFIAVGGDFAFGTSIILTSPDGITWTQRTSPSANPINSVTWSPVKSLFVAVDNAGGIFTSPDGIAWTTRTSPTANGFMEVIWAGTQFVAVGGGNAIVTSPDGIAWTLQNPPAPAAILRGVVWTGTQLVVVGDNKVLTSPNGTTWTAQTSPTVASLWGIAWSPTLSLYTAVGVTGLVYTSPTAVTGSWTLRAPGVTNSFFGIAWSGSQFVAVGDTGTIISSPDGITWSRNAVAGTGFSIPAATWKNNVAPVVVTPIAF